MSKSAALERVQRALSDAGSTSADGQEWRCPTHDDESASLTVKVGDEPGKVVLRCGAGCPTKRVLGRLGLKWADLFEPGVKVEDKALKRQRYVYTDEDGEPLFRVTKVPYESGKKDFFQQGSNGRGGWRKGKGAMRGVRLVLWRLPDVDAAIAAGKVIHLTEGEKDARASARRRGGCDLPPDGRGQVAPPVHRVPGRRG